MEIRFQGDQIDRPDPVHGDRAADDVESRGVERVWFLRERESRGRSSTLVPGERASDRGISPSPDADVQRLRGPGGEPLRRDGFASVLLNAGRWRSRRTAAPALRRSAVSFAHGELPVPAAPEPAYQRRGSGGEAPGSSP